MSTTLRPTESAPSPGHRPDRPGATTTGSAAGPGDGPGDRQSIWSDGVLVGLGGITVGVAVIMAAFGEVFVDALAILAVIIGVAGLAAHRRSRRLRFAVAALLAIFVAMNAVYAIGDLAHPESPAPFIGTLLVVTCGLVTALLAVAAGRGQQVKVGSLWLGVAALLAAAGVASLAAAAAVEDDVAEPGDVVVVAQDIEYPEEISVPADAAGLLIRNRDAVRHDFTVDGHLDSIELPAKTDVRIALDDLDPGTYRFSCSIPGHERMTGTLVIE